MKALSSCKEGGPSFPLSNKVDVLFSSFFVIHLGLAGMVFFLDNPSLFSSLKKAIFS